MPATPEARQEPGVAAAVPTPSTAEWHLSVSPRIAYRSLALLRPPNNAQFQISLENLDFIVGGATLSLTPPHWTGSELLLTVLYGGGGHSEFQLLAAGAPSAVRGRTDNALLDIELLYRRPFQDIYAQLYAGVQYIGLDLDVDLDRMIPGLDRRIGQSINTFLAKVGLGGFYPLSEDNSHRVFSNFLLGAGFVRNKSDFFGEESSAILGWDVNLGYQWIINPHDALSMRYRGQFLRPFGLKELVNDFSILHGPELQYSYRW